RGQARVGGARLDEADMRAGAVEALAGLGELRAAGVDADDVSPGTDQLGEQGGHHADAAPEVGDAHPAPESGVEEHAARPGSVQVVQDVEAVIGRLPGRERVLPGGAVKWNRVHGISFV